MLKAETATVYRGGNRRWLSLRTAVRAEAAAQYRLRHKCECEDADSSVGYPGYACENHGEHRERFIKKVSVLLMKHFRVTKGKP